MNGLDNENTLMKSIVSEALAKLLLVSSEKPDRILNSTDGKSKWRRGWFASVLGYIDMLGIDYFQKDEKLEIRISESRKSWTSGEMRQRALVLQSDIDQADTLINDILNYINNDK
ncbi:hypothetical protein KA111_00070 [Candidatus Woesebacteria bacterium]|nr:hypothetical protein [Candidatus Woesebacteria bacterium]